MNTKIFTLVIIISFAAYFNQSQAQDNYTVQSKVPPYLAAALSLKFQLFVPPTDTVRGIYFYLNGGSMDSYNFSATNNIYRSLATKHKFALLSANLRGDSIGSMGYYDIYEWLADSVYNVVNKFALLSGHSELKNAPFFLEGHSNGGSFSYNFSMVKPERIIGFIDLEGCAINPMVPMEGLSVPGYTFAGGVDNEQPVNHTIQGFINSRPLGAPWGFAIDPTAGHNRNTDTSILFSYFREIVNLRLPGEITIGSHVPLRVIDQSKGWLGDNQSFLIGPDSCFYLDKKYASWFPTQAIAQKWQKLVSRNIVTAIAQCGADSIQQPGYFGQTPPGETPLVFAPGLVSVRGRNEFRFEMSADSSQAGFTSFVSADAQPLDFFMAHFFHDICKYQRLFRRNDKWTYPSQQLDGYYMAGYSADMSKIFYCKVQTVQISSSPISDENFQDETEVVFNIPTAVYPSFTETGKMYFGDYDASLIYCSEKVDNTYDTPKVLPIEEGQFPFISRDEKYIIFELKGDLVVCFNDSNKWSNPYKLGASVNTAFKETCPSISPDGKYLFFSRADEPSGFRTWDTEKLKTSNIYWVSSSVIEKARMPSSTEYSHNESNILISPNPASHFLYLKNIPVGSNIRIYSVDGKLLKQQNAFETLTIVDINKLPNGIYIIKVNCKEGSMQQKFIKQ